MTITLHEIQEYADSAEFRRALQIPGDRRLTFRLLGQGEYNQNYLFCHPVTGQKLVLRFNTGSQMHLKDQIGYEYHALELLKNCGRTPKPLYVDHKKQMLVMEFLPGRPLEYHADLCRAAECLAAIHAVPVPADCGLLYPGDPLEAQLAECREMARYYLENPSGKETVRERIRRMLKAAAQQKSGTEPMPRCIINTELNSGNFLVNSREEWTYLIDWEKPILGEPAQDLGHFLAPTTTYWKTDVFLTREEKLEFLREYHARMEKPVPLEQLVLRTREYETMNCLRGVTWCAMAWGEYQNPNRSIRNPDTYRKIQEYLSREFLDCIWEEYFTP